MVMTMTLHQNKLHRTTILTKIIRTNKNKTKTNKRKTNKRKTNKRKTNKRKTNKRKTNKKGGGRMYNIDGSFQSIDEMYEGNEIFRKVTSSKREMEICKILMNNPNKNIIQIYRIVRPETGRSYIDMELLNTNITNFNIERIRQIMEQVKTFMQSLGIMYIDWKPDNIGIGADGELKLFDFDVSGLIDVSTGQWITEPPKFYSYKKAIEAGAKTPIEIDNYAFNLGLIEEE
jgi:serine/threonine protein kinase